MWVDVVIWYEGAVITEDREETNKTIYKLLRNVDDGWMDGSCIQDFLSISSENIRLKVDGQEPFDSYILFSPNLQSCVSIFFFSIACQ